LPVGVCIFLFEPSGILCYTAREVLDSELIAELELDAGFQIGVFERVDTFGDVPVLGGLVDA